MKNTVTIISTTCFVYLLLLFGCESKAKRTTNPVTFDSIQVAKTYYLFNDSTQPSCNLQISFIYPDSAPAQSLKSLQTVFVEKLLGDSFAQLSPKEAVQIYSQKYIDEFKRFETSIYSFSDETGLEDETGHSYYSKINNTILYNHNNFISFIVESLNYEGGAHGSQTIYGYVVDLNTGQLLHEDQFAGTNFKRNLSTIIAYKIAQANGVQNPKDLENLGYSSIEDMAPNDNFTINEKGITYYFNQDEIASYITGITQVFIPYEELNVYIKKESPISSIAGL